MDWTDREITQALTVGLVSVVWPLVLAAVRKVWPAFEDTEARRKLVAAVLSTFVVGATATQGTLKEKLLAGVVAVLLSQGGYNIVRVACRDSEK